MSNLSGLLARVNGALNKAWSDAARAAALEARRKKAGGGKKETERSQTLSENRQLSRLYERGGQKAVDAHVAAGGKKPAIGSAEDLAAFAARRKAAGGPSKAEAKREALDGLDRKDKKPGFLDAMLETTRHINGAQTHDRLAQHEGPGSLHHEVRGHHERASNKYDESARAFSAGNKAKGESLFAEAKQLGDKAKKHGQRAAKGSMQRIVTAFRPAPTNADIRRINRNPTDDVLERFERRFGITPNVNWKTIDDIPLRTRRKLGMTKFWTPAARAASIEARRASAKLNRAGPQAQISNALADHHKNQAKKQLGLSRSMRGADKVGNQQANLHLDASKHHAMAAHRYRSAAEHYANKNKSNGDSHYTQARTHAAKARDIVSSTMLHRMMLPSKVAA